jgi:hypothetical protein
MWKDAKLSLKSAGLRPLKKGLRYGKKKYMDGFLGLSIY